jgi:hypothetical protein
VAIADVILDVQRRLVVTTLNVLPVAAKQPDRPQDQHGREGKDDWVSHASPAERSGTGSSNFHAERAAACPPGVQAAPPR